MRSDAVDSDAVARAESALDWTWTELGFRARLPQTADHVGLSGTASVAIVLVQAVTLGLVGWADPSASRDLLLLVVGMVVGVAGFVLHTLTGDDATLGLFGTSRTTPRVAIEVRGDTLVVDGVAWPLAGLRRIGFCRDGGDVRLELDTTFRRWTSRPVPPRFGPAQQAVLLAWLHEARERTRDRALHEQALRDRARAATRALREQAARRWRG